MSDVEIDALKHRAMDAFKTHLLYSSATEQVRANVIVDLVQALTELQLEATTADRWLTAACDRADTMGHLWAKEAAEKQVALGRIDALTAKLAKAVERLTNMRDDQTGYRHVSHFRRGAAVTLAEIEGEKG